MTSRILSISCEVCFFSLSSVSILSSSSLTKSKFFLSSSLLIFSACFISPSSAITFSLSSSNSSCNSVVSFEFTVGLPKVIFNSCSSSSSSSSSSLLANSPATPPNDGSLFFDRLFVFGSCVCRGPIPSLALLLFGLGSSTSPKRLEMPPKEGSRFFVFPFAFPPTGAVGAAPAPSSSPKSAATPPNEACRAPPAFFGLVIILSGASSSSSPNKAATPPKEACLPAFGLPVVAGPALSSPPKRFATPPKDGALLLLALLDAWPTVPTLSSSSSPNKLATPPNDACRCLGLSSGAAVLSPNSWATPPKDG